MEAKMTRKLFYGFLLTLAFASALPAMAAAKRTVVVVHKGWPLHRPLPTVVVRPARRPVMVATATFLPPAVWVNTVVPLPPANRVVWEDSETIGAEEDWTEFTLNAGERGQRLDLQIDGAAELDFAEIVYDSGESQVVDFGASAVANGVYTLAELGGRRVDHARVVARSTSGSTKVHLLMEK